VTHRSPRGQNHGMQKKLPPIPERSRSSSQKRKVNGGSGGIDVSGRGCGGDASSSSANAGYKKKNTHGGLPVAPPTPESRRRIAPSPPQINIVGAVESRDDDEDLPVLMASAVALDKSAESKMPVGEVLVSMAPSSPPLSSSCTATSAPMVEDEIAAGSSVGAIKALPSSSPRITSKESPISTSIIAAAAEEKARIIPIGSGATSVVPATIGVAAIATPATKTQPARATQATPTPHENSIAAITNKSSANAMHFEKLSDDIPPRPNWELQASQCTLPIRIHGAWSSQRSGCADTACEDNPADESARSLSVKPRRFEVTRSAGETKKEYAPGLSLENCPGAIGNSAINLVAGVTTTNSKSNDENIKDIPDDEIMDSFMKRPYGCTPDKPRYYGDEVMDSTCREMRDQYQLGRLRARIDQRSGGGGQNRRELRGGENSQKGAKDSSPSNYKTLRSSRIQMRRNLYQYQQPSVDDDKQEDQQQQYHHHQQQQWQQQQLHKEQQQVWQQTQQQNDKMSDRDPSSPQSKASHEYIKGASSIQGSIANNTSITIPSLKHGQSIGQSLTLSSGISAVPSFSNSGAQPTASGLQSVSNSAMGMHSRVTSLSHSATGMVSRVQSVSNMAGVHSKYHDKSASSASIELSEYRDKIFTKMLLLMQDMYPDANQSLHEDDVSNIKEMVIDEGRASCGSIAELKLIHKLTEEEMSRILHEFEQNNSLVERKEQVAYSHLPRFNDQDRDASSPVRGEGDCGMERMKMEDDDGDKKGGENGKTTNYCQPPERIVYNDIATMSISSKFSDVTSPTCHDGFELDEIIPIPVAHRYHQQSSTRQLPPLPRSPNHLHQRKQKLPPSPGLSPAAATAASVAASMTLTTQQHQQQQPHHLPSVHEIPDTLDIGETANSEGSGEQTQAERDESEKCSDGTIVLTLRDETEKDAIDGMDAANAKAVEEPNRYLELIKGEDNIVPVMMREEIRKDAIEGTSTDKDVADLRNELNSKDTKAPEIDEPPKTMDTDRPIGEEDSDSVIDEKVAAVLALSRAAAREEHFHDEILSAVAKADDASSKQELGGNELEGIAKNVKDQELFEVESILSWYEEAEKRVMGDIVKAKAGRKAKAGLETNAGVDANAGVEPTFGESMETEQREDENAVAASPLDKLVSPKRVTFVEPSPDAQDEAMCGCVIQ